MSRLHALDRGALAAGAKEVLPADVAATVIAASQRVPDEMRFALKDDGTPDRPLNAYLRSLPKRGVRSPNSWKSYGGDLL